MTCLLEAQVSQYTRKGTIKLTSLPAPGPPASLILPFHFQPLGDICILAISTRGPWSLDILSGHWGPIGKSLENEHVTDHWPCQHQTYQTVLRTCRAFHLICAGLTCRRQSSERPWWEPNLLWMKMSQTEIRGFWQLVASICRFSAFFYALAHTSTHLFLSSGCVGGLVEVPWSGHPQWTAPCFGSGIGSIFVGGYKSLEEKIPWNPIISINEIGLSP